MNLLLSIPREVRDEIINLVILSPRPAPPISSANSNERYQRLDAYHSSHYSSGYNVFHEDLPNRTEFIPLLLVNHQLHDETTAVVQRLPASYAIDVMIYQERQLWPTWLLLPKLSNNIAKIYTTFRIAGFPLPKEGDGRMRTGFSRGCGGPSYIEWCFLDLWESLLRIGPTGQSTQPRSVKLLELDVISPNPNVFTVAPLDVEPHDLPSLRASSGIGYILNPASIVELISNGLSKLLTVSMYAEEYGGILYEGLGTIRLLHDGVYCQEWNITEMFENLQFWGRSMYHSRTRDERLESFNLWKMKLRKRRILVGLLESKGSDESDDFREVNEVREEGNEDEKQPEYIEDAGSSSKVEDGPAREVRGWRLALKKVKELVRRKKTE